MGRPSKPDKICSVCGKGFWPHSETAKFCSSVCMGIGYRSKGSVRVGSKIGLLTMIEPCGKEGTVCKKWKCQCDCGNIVYKSRSSITTRGETADCGCRTTWPDLPKGRRNGGASPFERSMSVFAKGSSKRGLDFSLTRDQVMELFLGDCYYCGAPPARTENAREQFIVRNGVDRVDNSIGYIPSNCVSCCYPCNWSKNDESVEVFIERCKRIASKHASTGVANAD